MMNKKSLLVSLILIVLFATVIVSVFKYTKSYGKISFTSNKDFVVDIYKIKNGDDIVTDKKPNVTINDQNMHKIGNGLYRYVAKFNDKSYKSIESNVLIKNDEIKIDLVAIMTEEQLSILLQQEINNINNAFYNKYSNELYKEYILDRGKLYFDGSWYGGFVVNKNNLEDDVLQVALQKQGGSWKVVVIPSITLSKDEYPNIPPSVLEDLNITQ